MYFKLFFVGGCCCVGEEMKPQRRHLSVSSALMETQAWKVTFAGGCYPTFKTETHLPCVRVHVFIYCSEICFFVLDSHFCFSLSTVVLCLPGGHFSSTSGGADVPPAKHLDDSSCRKVARSRWTQYSRTWIKDTQSFISEARP